MVAREFKLAHASHAVSTDGVEVEFLGRHELAYRTKKRSIVLTIETYIASDGAPDGVVVQHDDDPRWSDGAKLTEAQFDAIMDDLAVASTPLKTVFRRPAS